MGAIIRTTMTWAEARNLAYPNPQLMPATYTNLRHREAIVRIQINSLAVTGIAIISLSILGACQWPPIDTRIICGLMGVPAVIWMFILFYGNYKIGRMATQTALLAALIQDLTIVDQQPGAEGLARAIRATFIRAGNIV